MGKSKKNQYLKFRTTCGYLDNNTDLWSIIPKTKDYKITFEPIYTCFSEFSDKVTKTGLKDKKGNMVKWLGIRVSILLGMLMECTNNMEKEHLAKTMKVSKNNAERYNIIKMNELINAINKLLKQKIDNITMLFSESKPLFYVRYKTNKGYF